MWGPWGNWYFVSVASMFLLASLVIGWINRQDFRSSKNISADQRFSKIYFAGVSVMIPVCLLIAVASGLGNILLASQIGEWIAHSVSGVSGIGIIGFGLIIFFISLILSILIPSTSGFAAAFIPIFALTIIRAWNIQQQEAVVNVMIIAFLLASGLANFFTPTSAPLMAYTQYATISYGVWLKSLWKFLLITFVICIVVVVLSGALIPHVSF